MAAPKNAATEEAAGNLHNNYFKILLEMTKPIGEEELDDGSIRKVYDKDYVKMAGAALKDNKIQVIETAENAAGMLREQLAKKNKPMFKTNVQPLYATEEEVNAASK